MKVYANLCVTVCCFKEKNESNVCVSCFKLSMIYFGKTQVTTLNRMQNISNKRKYQYSPQRIPLSAF